MFHPNLLLFYLLVCLALNDVSVHAILGMTKYFNFDILQIHVQDYMFLADKGSPSPPYFVGHFPCAFADSPN